MLGTKDIRDIEFVVFDVETTGLAPGAGDRVVEIAALKVRGRKVVEEFHSLIDPQRPLSTGAFMVNGITPQMLAGAPNASQIMPRFLQFVQGSHLIGHNVRFDLGFVTNEFGLVGLGWEKEAWAIDTVQMARLILPGMGSYRLWWVARSLGIEEEQRHRALADVYLTWQVFAKLLEVAERRDLSAAEILSKSSRRVLPSGPRAGAFGDRRDERSYE